jgi:hypothetical protein
MKRVGPDGTTVGYQKVTVGPDGGIITIKNK